MAEKAIRYYRINAGSHRSDVTHVNYGPSCDAGPVCPSQHDLTELFGYEECPAPKGPQKIKVTKPKKKSKKKPKGQQEAHAVTDQFEAPDGVTVLKDGKNYFVKDADGRPLNVEKLTSKTAVNAFLLELAEENDDDEDDDDEDGGEE